MIGRKYRELSQGEKQTVLIARSLMDQPDLIIFDEASSGLDLFAREKLLRQIHHIKQLDHAPTMIYVTHHAEEITKDMTHVLLLKHGQVVEQGPKEIPSFVIFIIPIFSYSEMRLTRYIGIGQDIVNLVNTCRII